MSTPLLSCMRSVMFLTVFCAGGAPGAAAATTAVISSPGERTVVTSHVQWYIEPDERAQLTAEQAHAALRAGQFQQTDSGEWLELGILKGTVWLALNLQNNSQAEDLVLEFRNPRMSYIDCFIPRSDGTYRSYQSGAARPIAVRPIHHPMPAFPITLQQGEQTTVLLRVNNLGDFRTRLWIWPEQQFFNRISSSYFSEMVTIGVLLVLALYHFLVFTSLRVRAYLHLSLFITAWLLFFMAANGTGNMLLWGNWHWLAIRANTVFLICMCATFVLFTLAFLESRRFTPVLYWVANGFVLLCLLHLVYAGATETLLRLHLNRIMSLCTLLLVSLLAFQAIRRGNRMGWFFLVSWAAVLAAAGLMLLLSYYLVSARWVMGTPLIGILFTLSIIVWSFELTGRVKVRAREQRRLLEEQVAQRTSALQKALGEVKTLSGLLPICSSCKKIRDDKGYWNSVEQYFRRHTAADFTHGICPDCVEQLYPEYSDQAPG